MVQQKLTLARYVEIRDDNAAKMAEAEAALDEASLANLIGDLSEADAQAAQTKVDLLRRQMRIIDAAGAKIIQQGKADRVAAHRAEYDARCALLQARVNERESAEQDAERALGLLIAALSQIKAIDSLILSDIVPYSRNAPREFRVARDRLSSPNKVVVAIGKELEAAGVPGHETYRFASCNGLAAALAGQLRPLLDLLPELAPTQENVA